MAQTDCIGQLQAAMRARRDITGLACETFMRMFEAASGEETLVEQALRTQTVEFLVQLLDTRIERQDNQAATKAQIVKALKAMQRSLKYGEQVSERVTSRRAGK